MPRFLSHLLFLCIALIVLLLPLRVQAALPGTSGCTDEVPDGSLPDAFGGSVDHGGGGRHRERAEQKIEALREQQKKLRR